MSESRGFAGFAALYEQMVDWDRRLKREMPFYRSWVTRYGVKRVLDAACGVGRHATALAEMGLDVTGVDVEEEMIHLARRHAKGRGMRVRFLNADMRSLSKTVPGPYDGLLCVGNSLPTLDPECRRLALGEFSQVLRAGGSAVIHLLNFTRLLDPGSGMMTAQMRTSPDGRTRFVKAFREHAGKLELSVEYKEQGGQTGRMAEELFPVSHEALVEELHGVGLAVRETYADYSAGAFRESISGDLILVTVKEEQ